MTTDPCEGVPDGDYTFGTCRDGALVAPGQGLVGGNANWYLQVVDHLIDSGYITFYYCAPVEGGYMYVRTPSGKLLGKVDVPKNACREDKIDLKYFTEKGNYVAAVADYNGVTKRTQAFTPAKPGSPNKQPSGPSDSSKIYALVIALVIVVLAIIMLGDKR